MISAGIIGAAGYTAGELIQLLLHHPKVELKFLQSESQSGKPIVEVHTGLVGETKLKFENEFKVDGVDIIFLCKGHGESAKIIKERPEILGKKVVDLSQDFRLSGNHDFIYGLPELNKDKVISSNHVANPGCFATAIQLGLLPVFKEKVVSKEVSVSGITGSTGAGQSLSTTSHFSWRNNNASVYKPLTHQHLHEIDETLKSLHTEYDGKIHFVPYRGAFTRGIITTSHFETHLSYQELWELYENYFRNHPFTHVTTVNPDLKMVVNSNKCMVFPQVINGVAIITSVIDNLLKGASGQAVQNMNSMVGLDETMGLQLKTVTF